MKLYILAPRDQLKAIRQRLDGLGVSVDWDEVSERYIATSPRPVSPEGIRVATGAREVAVAPSYYRLTLTRPVYKLREHLMGRDVKVKAQSSRDFLVEVPSSMSSLELMGRILDAASNEIPQQLLRRHRLIERLRELGN